jgi:serine phosphatase RsbU (regulator of sigma subunit)/GAF domain-containing protein
MVQINAWALSTLAQVARAIASAAHDPQELAEVTFLEIARLVPVDFFQLGLYEEDHYQTLILIRDGNRLDNLKIPLNAEDQNLMVWVYRTSEPMLIHDYRQEADHLPAIPSYETDDPPVSGVFIPLRVASTTVGLLALESREQAAFSEEHLQLLSLLGHSLAASLSHQARQKETEFLTLNMILVQEISRLLMSLDPLRGRLQQVLALLAEVLNFSQVAIYEVIEDQIKLQTAMHREDGQQLTGDLPGIVQLCVDRLQVQLSNLAEEVDESEDSPHREYAFPLLVVDSLLGVLYLQCPDELDIEGEQGNILRMLANQLGFAMLEARNEEQHQEEAWMTTVLLEVAKHASQPGDTLVALQAVLQLATLLAGTDWALLLLPDESGEALWIGVNAGFRRQETLALESLRLRFQQFDLEAPFTESETPEVIDLPPELADLLDQSQALCLQLTDGESLLGLLLMKAGPLPGIRPSLLAGIGHQVSLRLENARLIEEAALRRSLERELMMARNIQASFLPDRMPRIQGWELAAAWEVAHEVGGDFYDVIPLPPSSEGIRWGIVIADVADKGVPAALYMALCRTMLRSVAQANILPGHTLEIVNQQLISDTRSDLFVSVFYGVWEPATARITYANAGHLPPFLFKLGKRAQLIREHGMVLGVMPEAQYHDQIIVLEPGDLLVLYTDGVSEAQNDDHELFGFQRLESLILSLENWEATAIASAIVERVIEFSGGGDFSDDLTTVTMRRRS